MDYIDQLGTILPNLKSHLNPPADIRAFFPDRLFPESFLRMYQLHDGEKSSGPGIFGGFAWMPLVQIIETQQLLSEASCADKYTAEDGLITQCGYSENWIPFAEDYGGNFLALDLMPGPNGQYGQIITLDRDSDEVFVLTDSIDGLLELFLQHIKAGLIKTEGAGDSTSLYWHSGHLFNDLPELAVSKPEGTPIELPDYWARMLNLPTKTNTAQLALVKRVVINNLTQLNDQAVDLAPLAHCKNVTELICHCDRIVSFEPITHMKALKKSHIKSTASSEDLLKFLANATSLIELGLISANINTLTPLATLKLKTLSLTNCEIQDAQSIAALKNLTELRLDKLNLDQPTWITQINGLKKLTMKQLAVTDYSFLSKLNKLEYLAVSHVKNSAEFDSAVASIAKLKWTDWPFSDLSLIAGNTKLTSIGIDLQRVEDFSPLRDTHITSVHFKNAFSEPRVKKAEQEIRKFIKLSSSSRTGF